MKFSVFYVLSTVLLSMSSFGFFTSPYADFENPRLMELSSFNDTSPKFDLIVFIEKNSGWDSLDHEVSPLLRDQLLKNQEIFKQCGVVLNKVRLYDFTLNDLGKDALAPINPNSIPHYVYWPKVPSSYFLEEIKAENTIILVLNQNYSTGAYTWTSSTAKKYADARGSAWVAFEDHKTYPGQFFVQKTYNLMAHEIAHVLGELSHTYSPIPNLMTGYEASSKYLSGKKKTGDLNFEQCESIRQSKYIY